MAEKWQQLSVLIVGCGSIGKRHAEVLQSLGVEDIRACDQDERARQKMPEIVGSIKLYDSYQAALSDNPDTVLICTPNHTHVPVAIQAIEAGCHVLSEKPISESNDRIDELSALAEKEGKKIMVALCFRYHLGILKVREHLLSGRFGRVISIRAMMGEHLPTVRPDYKSISCKNGAFNLTHDIDLALWMADQPIKQVHSIFGNYSDIGIEGSDIVELIVDFESNCAASIHLDFFQWPRHRQLELICTQGQIAIEFASWDHCTVSTYESQENSWQHEKIKTQRNDMFKAENTEFLRAVAEDLPIKCTIEQARKSLDVILAAKQYPQ
ncbi:Gfo/Idh/MocA family protein [Planctomycetota bacterium]